LAHLYRSLGRSDAAIAGYKAALKLDPKSPQNWYQLATLYLDLGRTDDARETFRQALVFSPNMGSAYNSLGAIAFRTGDLEEAEHLIRKGLLLEPRTPRGHFNLARVLEARGDRKDAEGLYREELEIYADNGKARFNLAQLLREEGDPEGYIRELRNGVQKAPEFGPCYFYLAREELGAGRLEEARDLARKGLEVDPHSEVAALGHYVLADVYSREGASAKAQQEVAAAHQAEATRRSKGAS
ncbi:MAG TPA: tetratricopeptide repeat protein, partial [Vicinamibacteria bacterium]|nr:tetratricopeptide repeat protein [Vicinamibacteria bacterium]